MYFDLLWMEFLYCKKALTLRIIANSADKKPSSRFWDTPLHCAADIGHFNVFKFIIESVEVKVPENNFGWTPLHSASKFGHFEQFRLSYDVNRT